MQKRIRNKYGSSKVSYDTHSFASKLEAGVYALLKLREYSGEIKILQTQAHYYLTVARILFIPDFKCQDLKTNEIFYVEAKGFNTPVYAIKKRLWKFFAKERLEVYKGSYKRPYLDETITPELQIDEAHRKL